MSTKVIFRRAEVWLPRRPQAVLPRSQVFSEKRKWRHTWKADKYFYYSTMMSFYHIWSRERAKYETVIHCSVPV